ncbi:hypothetical protein AGMMS49587_16390 [Spirochaetia bacterium]|nr:hypothetical protein AGMMS49587_16390 [Spirochaetia bacterium]
MKRGVFLLVPILVMVLSVFSACNGKDGSKAVAGSDAKAAAASAEKKVLIWCWDNSDRRKDMHAEFTKRTGIDVELFAVLAKDMAQKLQTTLASNGDMPDIAWCEATYRGKLLSLDIWEDTTKAPYNFDKSNVVDYLIPLETSEDGRWVGPECPSVGGMAYKRDLAKQYFGTDDPEELEKLFPTWDAFKKAGLEVQAKSGGKVFMMTSLGLALQFMKGQSNTPFIQNSKLNLENSMQPILQQLIEFKQSKVTDVLDIDSPEEGASYATNEHIFYPCANWSLVYTIRANDRNGQGRWGFMLPPGGAFPWGGTVMGVPKKGQRKENGVAYIKFFFGSEEGAILQRDRMGNFSPYKPLYQNPNFYTAQDEYFRGQDVQKAVAQRVLPAIKSPRVPSPYDQDINDVFNLAIKKINTGAAVTAASLVAESATELVNKNPAIKR